MKKYLLLFLCLSGLSISVLAQTTIIYAGRLINGIEVKPAKEVTIVVEGNKK